MIGWLNSPEDFSRVLRARMADELPGAEAQDQMTSRARMPLQAYLEKHPDYRTSAVLMILYPYNDTIHTVIIQRPSYEGIHSGQLALPGGKTEEGDESPVHTALRETMEEIGVNVQEDNLLGALTPLYIPPSNFLVHTYVAWMDDRPDFLPDEREVESVLEIPLTTFLDPEVKGRRRIYINENTSVEAPCYILGEHVLWGATAMMFSELEAILRGK